MVARVCSLLKQSLFGLSQPSPNQRVGLHYRTVALRLATYAVLAE